MPDLAAIKARQQATWASGDFGMVAARIVWPAEKLCEAADLQAGWRVLDVATGTGNAALAAARRGCKAVGVDYVPALLARGRKRAEAELLDVEFHEGDAENLPFPDASFDAVTSIYGAMFAPDHAGTARELVRVCRPGGVIALASWTPAGFIGDTFRVVAKYVPMVAGVTPPICWGDETYLKAIFGTSIRTITSTVEANVFRYPSAEANVEFFRTYYGPTLKLFEAVGASGACELTKELADLARRYDRNGGTDGPIAIVAEYLQTVIVTA
jgi:ubiquinone/menaquinone biosynthesis C-methylase UbiE